MLTREEIEKMPAGAELNKELGIALGLPSNDQWHILDETDGGSFIKFDTKAWAEHWLDQMKREHPASRQAISGKVVLIRLWPWLSNGIDAAWQAVAAMQKRGFYLKLHTPFELGQPYFAAFDQHGVADTRPPWEASADTAALAICRSALLVMLAATPSLPTPQTS